MLDASETRAALYLKHLVQDVLLPAHNAYDLEASQRLQADIVEEEQRDQLPRKDDMGGARTHMVARGMARKAEQHRRVLRALL